MIREPKPDPAYLAAQLARALERLDRMAARLAGNIRLATRCDDTARRLTADIRGAVQAINSRAPLAEASALAGGNRIQRR